MTFSCFFHAFHAVFLRFLGEGAEREGPGQQADRSSSPREPLFGPPKGLSRGLSRILAAKSAAAGAASAAAAQKRLDSTRLLSHDSHSSEEEIEEMARELRASCKMEEPTAMPSYA